MYSLVGFFFVQPPCRHVEAEHVGRHVLLLSFARQLSCCCCCCMFVMEATCGFPLRLSARLLFLGLIVQLICRHVLKMSPLSFLLCSIFFSLSCRQGQNRIAVEENTTLLRLIASVIFVTNAEMRMFVTNLLGQRLSCKKSLNGTTPVSLAIHPIIYVLDHIC